MGVTYVVKKLLLILFFLISGSIVAGEREEENSSGFHSQIVPFYQISSFPNHFKAHVFRFQNIGHYGYAAEFRLMGTSLWTPWVGDYRASDYKPDAYTWTNRKEDSIHWFTIYHNEKHKDFFVRIVAFETREDFRNYAIWAVDFLNNVD